MSSPNEDKKDIELEEREKKMNEENKAHDNITKAEDAAVVSESENEKDKSKEKEKEAEATGKIKSDDIKDKEVKPKKIPTGGIQLPGFFTRSKSKEKCKDTDEETGEGTELVEQENKPQTSRIKLPNLPNPFRKSKLVNEDDETKQNEPSTSFKEKVNKLCLPITSVLPWLKKEPDQNLEHQTKAGLASMETLDENDKSADAKQDEMKTIPLDDKPDDDKEKDVEKQAEDEPTWKQKAKAYRYAISAILAFTLLFIIILAIIIPSGRRVYAAPIRDGMYVEAVTSCGLVEGILDDGAVAFRGIPYARPPIGDLRLKPAQPLNNIDYCWNGTMKAHNATETCLQIHSNGTLTGAEDCLTIDVVTPYVRYESPLPVIVLIGTESLNGGSPGKMRPSARYARSRDVLFVRPNFRMGALGFMALDILSKDVYPYTSGNYGLSDIIEALKWIQLNIAHFGGDPKQVTVFGHRAGATLVTALSTIKKANKLFARAWATSGGSLFPNKSLADAEKENESYLAALNCKDVECLRKADAADLMKAVPDIWRRPPADLPAKDEEPKNKHEWLVLDGKILQEHPATIWASEEGLSVKLVLGTTAHAAANDKLLNKNKEWTEDLVAHHVRSSLLSNLSVAEEALKLYPKTYKGLTQMVSDIRVVCPLFAISTQMANSTFYVVTQVRGEQNISDADSDVDAILGRYEPKTPEQRRYFSAIQQLFYHFVWQGKVSSEVHTKVFVVEQDVMSAQNYSRCDFWINKDVVLKYAQLD